MVTRPRRDVGLPHQPMSHFRLLADPGRYAVTDVDLLADADARAHWVQLFDDHFNQVLDSARQAYGRTHLKQLAAARADFTRALEPLRGPSVQADGPLGIFQLCRMREKALRDHGLDDPFRPIKQRENDRAIDAFPEVIDYADSLEAPQRWEHLFRGVFAGNIFDLGSAITMGYTSDHVDFEAEAARVKPRPWRVDDFDALAEILPLAAGSPAPWAKVVFFIDNAGADFILGVMPLVRQLASHGSEIVLAANERPSLNDLTADETVDLVQQLAAVDDELASYLHARLFEVVSTGNDIPLIDLSEVSDELNAAAEGADLVVLEGMGRSVESNLNTTFSVASLQICLLKDDDVARRVGGEVFDCVCMYRPAP